MSLAQLKNLCHDDDQNFLSLYLTFLREHMNRKDLCALRLRQYCQRLFKKYDKLEREFNGIREIDNEVNRIVTSLDQRQDKKKVFYEEKLKSLEEIDIKGFM